MVPNLIKKPSSAMLQIILVCAIGLILRLIFRTEQWGYLSPDEAQYLSNAIGLFTDITHYGVHYRPGFPV